MERRVPTSVYVGIETWQKTRDFRVNRSEVCRRALEDEVKRIEAEKGTRAQSAKTVSGCTSKGGQQDVSDAK